MKQGNKNINVVFLLFDFIYFIITFHSDVEKQRFNYVFYDPEMHWCQTCDVFPKTAKDYLNHLHSKEHLDKENLETPWHTNMITDVSFNCLFINAAFYLFIYRLLFSAISFI